MPTMILAGGELERLHRLHGVRSGRPDNSRNGAGIKWGDLVKRECGVSEDTANRYRAMFAGAKKRVPMLNVPELLGTPLGQLPEPKRQQLLAAVHKATDGKTGQQLMWDWNLAKRPQGSEVRGGNTTKGGGDDTPEASNSEVIVAGKREQTRQLTALLEEYLTDRPWNACEKTERQKLHGLLTDAAAAVKDTFK